jgi:hypothetical protein
VTRLRSTSDEDAVGHESEYQRHVLGLNLAAGGNRRALAPTSQATLWRKSTFATIAHTVS